MCLEDWSASCLKSVLFEMNPVTFSSANVNVMLTRVQSKKHKTSLLNLIECLTDVTTDHSIGVGNRCDRYVMMYVFNAHVINGRVGDCMPNYSE